MEMTSWLTLAIFAATILVVITGIIDRSVAAMLGVVVMIWSGVMTEVEAFLFVDWNVMAILTSIWVIAGLLSVVVDQLLMRFPRAQPPPLAPTPKLAAFARGSLRRRLAVAGSGTF